MPLRHPAPVQKQVTGLAFQPAPEYFYKYFFILLIVFSEPYAKTIINTIFVRIETALWYCPQYLNPKWLNCWILP